MKTFVVAFLVLVNILLTTAVNAAQQLSDKQYIDSRSWVLGAAVGYGKLSNPLFERDDIPLYILPDIRYYGERFSIDNLNVSYALIEKSGFVIELAGTQNQDGVYFPGDHRRGYGALVGAHPAAPITLQPKETKPIEPTHRSMSYLAGLEMRYYGWLNLYASWQTDVSKVHQGAEAKFRAIKHIDWRDLQVTLEAAAIYKSEELVDYYYNVGLSEVFNSQYHYNANATTNYLLGVNLAYPLSENLAIVGSVQKKWLGDEITDSPVVMDESPYSFFVGVKYVL